LHLPFVFRGELRTVVDVFGSLFSVSEVGIGTRDNQYWVCCVVIVGCVAIWYDWSFELVKIVKNKIFVMLLLVALCTKKSGKFCRAGGY
jgi:hypothetical protein